MNHETAMRLQAWLDGELPPDQTAEVARLVTHDAEAQALATELRTTRDVLAAGEAEHPLAESREFYWSKIDREIRRLERASLASERPHSLGWLLRYLAPAAVAAALAVVVAFPVLRDKFASARTDQAEIESPLEDIGSLTFRSESERMTVVWVNTQ